MKSVKEQGRARLAAWACVPLMALLPLAATAAPAFSLTGSQITGITGLAVAGTIYNVSFVDSQCDRLRSVCASNDPLLGNSPITQATAEASQNALFNFFFRSFRLDPTTTILGCEFAGDCRLVTATQTDISSTAGAVFVDPTVPATTLMQFAHFDIRYNFLGGFTNYDLSTGNATATVTGSSDYNTGVDGRSVYAVWTAVTPGDGGPPAGGGGTTPPGGGTPTPGSVPEPGSLALAGLALGGLAWVRRRTARGPAAA